MEQTIAVEGEGCIRKVGSGDVSECQAQMLI